jgi:hypothetical protein
VTRSGGTPVPRSLDYSGSGAWRLAARGARAGGSGDGSERGVATAALETGMVGRSGGVK